MTACFVLLWLNETRLSSRPGFSKAILVIREKIVCFKEGKKLFSDDGDMSEVIGMGR